MVAKEMLVRRGWSFTALKIDETVLDYRLTLKIGEKLNNILRISGYSAVCVLWLLY